MHSERLLRLHSNSFLVLEPKIHAAENHEHAGHTLVAHDEARNNAAGGMGRAKQGGAKRRNK